MIIDDHKKMVFCLVTFVGVGGWLGGVDLGVFQLFKNQLWSPGGRMVEGLLTGETDKNTGMNQIRTHNLLVYRAVP